MIEGRSVIAIVPARAGSRRLPGKNLKPLAGRPMIDWTLEAARRASTVDRVVVTSDSAAVLARAAEFGAGAVVRPDALAGDEAPVAEAVVHALEAVGGRWDYVVLLQPTSPLREAADIDGAVTLCHRRGAPAVLGVAPLSKPAGFYRSMADDQLIPGPAGLESAVRINGAVYVVRGDDFLARPGFHPEGALGWVMPLSRSWDVDDSGDFAMCEALAAGRGL